MTTKKFSYLLVKTGTLMLKAHSDHRGYTPGQVIRLAAEIHNKSGKDTGCVLASLIQVPPAPLITSQASKDSDDFIENSSVELPGCDQDVDLSFGLGDRKSVV